ncbi:hypothetical protein BJV77DRAFT_1066607 [Russula vinacea]|nr:hypothetical protein BJV77DRAFT_1066607 [Russula vinacea]
MAEVTKSTESDTPEFQMGGFETAANSVTNSSRVVGQGIPKNIININPNKPTECLEASETLKNATKSSSKMTFTNADLPTACLPLWNKCYIPLLCDWAGTLANPWNYHDGNVKKNLQSMWDIVYPNIKANIQPKQFIFVQHSKNH